MYVLLFVCLFPSLFLPFFFLSSSVRMYCCLFVCFFLSFFLCVLFSMYVYVPMFFFSLSIYLSLFNSVSLLNDMENFVVYLMPKSSMLNMISGSIQPIEDLSEKPRKEFELGSNDIAVHIVNRYTTGTPLPTTLRICIPFEYRFHKISIVQRRPSALVPDSLHYACAVSHLVASFGGFRQGHQK